MVKIKNKLTINSNKFCFGFTFVEVMVAVVVLGLVATATTGLFLNTLKNKRKTEALSNITRSGDYALAIMTNKIKNAQTISCSSSPFPQIIITNLDRTINNFRCVSNNLFLDDSMLIKDYVLACSFSCQTNTTPPSVTINFTLFFGNSNEGDNYVSQNFTTKVSLRTYD
ncbi:MAG: prepilin-type N-terminal cleavage/methylation domain-containing protein [Candidatus Omnitrophica bacterium]|nr:prepilin-type N-terminal cleavage/methylation domain-containing protein [Candidatus Omnitrophota bacterium]